MPAFVPYTSAPTHLGAFRSVPGVLSNVLPGAPFLTDLYGPYSRFIVQWAPGAYILGDPDAFPWEDISGYVLQPNAGGAPAVNITPMGRSDEFSIAQPAGCSFKVKNNTGKFSKGPQNPNVKLNVPIRVLLQLGLNTGASTRFYGYANGFPATADSTGNYQIVTISASGSTRRLFQGNSVLKSSLYRAMTFSSVKPFLYYPMEEGASSTYFTPAIGSAFLVPNGAVTFGNATGADGSDRVATIGQQATVTAGGVVTPTSRVRMEIAFHMASGSIGAGVALGHFIMQPFGGTPNGNAFFTLGANAARGLYAEVFDSVYDSGAIQSNIAIDDGLWHWASLDLLASGGNINVSLSLDGIVRATGTVPSRSFSTIFTQRIGNSDPSRDVGHWTFWVDQMPVINTYSAFTGWANESATDRLVRLCNEEGIQLDLHGTSNVLMGAQSITSRQALLRECEMADRGVLVDGFGPGLTYWSHSMRSMLVTAPALTLAVGSVNGGDLSAFQPVDNDQRNVNKFTMNRKNGSKAAFEDSTSPMGDGTNGIGSYESSDTINVSSDAALLNQAAWRVREGTNNEPYRYPGIDINFANSRAAQHAQDWLNASLMSRIDGTNPELYMSSHPAGTISSVLEGYSEGIGSRYWRVSAVLGPAHPWDADVLAQTFRLDTAGSVLADAATVGSTSLSVIVTGNALWATSAALPQDFPMWLDINGFPVRLTAADAYSNSNPYFEIDASGWQVIGGTSTFTQSNLQQHQGAFSGRLSPDGVTSGIQIRTDEVVAQAGQFWTAEAWVRSTLGHTWSMFINLYDLSHTLITSVTLASLSLNPTTWTRFPVADPSVPILAPTQLGAIAPTGTQFARLGFIVPDVLNVTDFTYFDQVRFIGKRQQFTVDATTVALPANSVVKLWKPAVLAL